MTHGADYRFGEFELSGTARVLQRDGGEVELQPKVFDTLLYLVRNADRVVPKEELLDEIWAGTVVTDNALARAISALRKALGDTPQARTCSVGAASAAILLRYGAGYERPRRQFSVIGQVIRVDA